MESKWDKNIDEIFFYFVTCDIVNRSEDHEPRSVTECWNRHDCIKWKDTIHTELIVKKHILQ